MIKRVFVDTDIILDVALARKPFLESSKLVLALLENYYNGPFRQDNFLGSYQWNPSPC